MKEYHVFDLDGTLADSMPVWSKTMLKIIDEDGAPYPDDLIRIITPLGYRGTAEYFMQLGVKDSSAKELEDKMYAEAYLAYKTQVQAKQGVKQYLESLKEKGAKLYVLTASPHLTTDACLKNNGLFELFDEVWSTDDFSLPKSDERIYRELSKRLGCRESEIAFYDDNLINLQTAKRAGIYTVGVYDFSSDSDQAEIKATANEYCRSFEELL